ncbi:hypothetical protein K443DRAFT_90935 [Laccaria amethystina LaAM-08-1]|uniref:Uncharacterized protein n=1 Tax=Laccaria amethystina LaAM-08-1 TaxID=1095629 RepID=A0A0C9XL12_9AGAR|nr:hypothetical protein K443DRAFT_90935 [Laccaria amethystina LaAM-08-1]
MRDENRRLYEQFAAERRKSEKLVNVVGRLWDVVGKGFPGSLPPFPQDILEPESPNIYITSPTSSLAPRLSMSISNPSLHSMHSPNSSPTTVDFPSHIPGHHHHPHHGHHHHHTLSRQHSFQHVSFSRDGAFSRDNSTSSTPLPSSPGEIGMDAMFDDSSEQRSSSKRQRLNSDGGGGGGMNPNGSSEQLLSSVSSPGSGPVSLNHNHNHSHSHSHSHNPGTLSIPSASLAHPAGSLSHPPTLSAKKSNSRARSDSAPLGYALPSWQQPGGLSSGIGGRPRSGSGMGPRVVLGMNGNGNGGGMTGRAQQQQGPGGTPLLSITTAGAGER